MTKMIIKKELLKRFVPKCKICNDTGEIFVEASDEGRKFLPCDCKKRYSYGDMTKTDEEHRQNLTLGLLKSMKRKNFIKRGSREEFYDQISYFITYYDCFLPELAKSSRMKKSL